MLLLAIPFIFLLGFIIQYIKDSAGCFQNDKLDVYEEWVKLELKRKNKL